MNRIYLDLISIIKIFYGEIFNKKNKIKTRFFRIFARFNILSKIFLNFYLYRNSKSKLETSKNDLIIIDTEKAIKFLKEDGIFHNISLNKGVAESINSFFLKNSYFNFNRDKNKKIKFSEKERFEGLYILSLMNPHLENKICNDIAYNKDLIKVIQEYFGGIKPILEWSQIYWSFPLINKDGSYSEPPNNEYGFHYDIDGFKFLKVFFYLSNVDENCGPHTFVKKSGEKNYFKLINRRADDEIIKNKYSNNIIKLTGEIGQGFIEDTSFYHKGEYPKKERGVLALLYNISTW